MELVLAANGRTLMENTPSMVITRPITPTRHAPLPRVATPPRGAYNAHNQEPRGADPTAAN